MSDLLYGPPRAHFHDIKDVGQSGGEALPQYFNDTDMANVIASYREYQGPIRAVRLQMFRPATNEDVELASLRCGIEIDWDEISWAYGVATNPPLRAQLIRNGFDSYMDFSPVENQEPMHYIVFADDQVLDV